MADILVPAGSFSCLGGWVLDTQFVSIMGGPYLLAHGLGNPVSDAMTTVEFPEQGTYHVYVYTSNWTSPWKKGFSPGVFQLAVDDTVLSPVFGTHEGTWDWEYGGTVEVSSTTVHLALKDLTGFEGRCGFLYFSTEKQEVLPTDPSEMFALYRKAKQPPLASYSFDFVVVGGGIAGMCAAVCAARQGLKTALIQDREVFGGNNSSEVRVWLGGLTNLKPFEGIGNIVGEFEQERIGHYGAENQADLYEDAKKRSILEQQENLQVFSSSILMDSRVAGSAIASVLAWKYRSDTLIRLDAPLFCDCTGDGSLGSISGADFEVTTNGHMGMTNIWYVEKTDSKVDFPSCPWAVDLKEVEFPGRGEVRDVYDNQREMSLGCWFWESGCELDPILYAEYARDLNFRAMYGAWDCLKNHDHDYPDHRLGFAAFIGGKRESRRLLGDVILTKAEVMAGRPYEDGCVPSTWNFDVHYPDRRFYAAFHEGDGFLTKDYRQRYTTPYFIPYRCLYSRNISNLFMAGRNISVTHDALGAARVMRTCGMMGEVVGYAASLCRTLDASPRQLYEKHLAKLLIMLKGLENKEVPKPNIEMQMHNDQ
jgi:hypothetical protein